MYLFVIFVLIGMTAPLSNGVDPEIRPYYDAVVRYSEGNLGKASLNIGFTDDEARNLGRCYYFKKSITINKKNWKKLNQWDRILLVAHEVMHCECMHLGHNNELLDDFCPSSIMHSSDGGKRCNLKHFGRYVKEMQTVRCD